MVDGQSETEYNNFHEWCRSVGEVLDMERMDFALWWFGAKDGDCKPALPSTRDWFQGALLRFEGRDSKPRVSFPRSQKWEKFSEHDIYSFVDGEEIISPGLRLAVFGGWFVFVGNHGPVFFLPDPAHKWEITDEG